MRIKPLIFVFALLVSTIPAISAAASIFPDWELTGVSPEDPLALSKMQRRVEQLEREQGYFSVRLYRPLRHLGLLALSTGQHEDALDAFSRMQNLVHRHHGVDSVLQLESVDYSIDTLTAMGKPLEVEKRHMFRLMTAERGFDANDPELVYAKLKAADWYRNTARHHHAVDLYQQAAELLPESNERTRMRVLRSMALTHYLSSYCCAEENLKKAIDLAEMESFDTVERASIKRDYLDLARLTSADVSAETKLVASETPAYLGFASMQAFHMFHEKDQTVGRTKVLTFAEEAPEKLAPVGAPVAMCGTTLDSLVKHRREYRLDVSLYVDADGRPGDIAINGEAPARLKRYLRKSLKAGKFRPATDDQGSYTSAELSFEQTFGVASNVAVSSRSPVSEWHHMMVAQACQLGSGTQI